MILFLDSNILIYLIEGDELLVAQVQQTIQRYRAAYSEIVTAYCRLILLPTANYSDFAQHSELSTQNSALSTIMHRKQRAAYPCSRNTFF